MTADDHDRRIHDLDARRITMLDRARNLVPVMDEARRAIAGRGEHPTNARMAEYLVEIGVEPLFGSGWYQASVSQTMRIDAHQRKIAERLLKLRGPHRPDARREHDLSVAAAREVALMLR